MMKILVLLILTLFSDAVFAQYDSLYFGGYNRTYLLHLPPGYNQSGNYPMIIAMHGGFGNAFNLENQSQLSAKADAENFIVVYPEGVKSPLGIRTWNAGDCCGYASSNNIDDVGFLNTLIDTLVERYSIDTTRIYATGMSNGGFMAYRLACELSDRIAAIAPVASSMTMEECVPERAVPVIHFHSYLDTNVPYRGGTGTGFSNHYNPPLDSVVNLWSALDSCKNIADITDNSQYTLWKSSDCNCETEVRYYITKDGGHSWPGGVRTPLGDPPSEYINATDLMWDFFKLYSLICNTSTRVEEAGSENRSGGISVFPNPTEGRLYVFPRKNFQNIKISVFTLLGEKVLTVTNAREINIKYLAAGKYFLKIELDGKTFVRKIIKTD